MNPQGKVEWYLRPWVVIFLLFFVLGPFGLPLVYKSPKFNPLARTVLTVLMGVYTWYVVLLTVKFFYQISTHFETLRFLLES